MRTFTQLAHFGREQALSCFHLIVTTLKQVENGHFSLENRLTSLLRKKFPSLLRKQWKEKENPVAITEKTPDHIAIIMDGNGRWARKRGMPRFAGHKEGISTVVKIVKAAVHHNVKVLTLYAFSTENWKRPKTEIDFIMKLPKEFLNMYLPDLIANNVRVKVIGDLDSLPAHTREALQHAISQTQKNDGLKLNFALNYGGRQEIVNAFNRMLKDIKDAKLQTLEVDDQQIANYLSTADMTDPDLLIRTGGEKRISNFLLWQLAYTEFWFTDILWPDFTETEFEHALAEYQQRKRRYGGI